MNGRLFGAIDGVIGVVCLPFFAAALPAVFLFEWTKQRRRVKLGMEVTHWIWRGVREDFRVVDVSRVAEGLVGVQVRRWSVLHFEKTAPAYNENVEYITTKHFWVPRPVLASLRRPRK